MKSVNEYKPYSDAVEKLASISTQFKEAEEAFQTLLHEGKPEHIKSLKERQVQAILDGEEPSEVKAHKEWQSKLENASERRRLFSEACEIQKGEVDKQRYIASKKICEAQSSVYKELVRKRLLMLIEAQKAFLSELEFRDSLDEGRVEWTSFIRMLGTAGMGNPLDLYSRFTYLLKEAIEHNYLKVSDIPREWREFWMSRDGFKFPGDTILVEHYDEHKAIRAKRGGLSKVLEKTKKVKDEEANETL